MGFATSKAHKRETQGKYFDLLFFSEDHIRIFRFDFKISAIIWMKIFAENMGRKIIRCFSRKLLQKSGENLRKNLGKNLATHYLQLSLPLAMGRDMLFERMLYFVIT